VDNREDPGPVSQEERRVLPGLLHLRLSSTYTLREIGMCLKPSIITRLVVIASLRSHRIPSSRSPESRQHTKNIASPTTREELQGRRADLDTVAEDVGKAVCLTLGTIYFCGEGNMDLWTPSSLLLHGLSACCSSRKANLVLLAANEFEEKEDRPRENNEK